MQTLTKLALVLSVAGVAPPAAAKDLIEYFKPTPIVGSLSANAWGAAATGPRDPKNGLEDATLEQWVYWDGQILRGSDGKYHMLASRWDQTRGHAGWGKSIAVHAVSDNVLGPYVDTGQAYTDSAGKGHNVTGALLPTGKYTLIVSDTRPGDIFLSDSLEGPWAYQGSISVDANGFDASGTAKNLSLVVRPDKSYLMATRFGAIMTTPSNLLGPWKVQGPRAFTTPAGYPNGSREDPVIWCSGGQYHLVYNYYDLRKARHLVSPDGINNWKDVGIAYDPTANFVRYTDGTVNHWYKMERPAVFLQNGHVTHFTFAVIDVTKAEDLGDDTHGSKIIVVPFDGAAFDADTGVPGNACSTYSQNSGVPPTGSGGAGGSAGSAAAGSAGSAAGGSAGNALGGSGGIASGGAAGTIAGGSSGASAAGSAGAIQSAAGSSGSGGVSGAPTTGTAGTSNASSGSAGLALTSGAAGVVGSAGRDGAAGASAPQETDSSGCSCRTASGSQRNAASSLLAALGALALTVTRRRRRCRALGSGKSRRIDV